MSILINKDTKIITQGITGKTGQFHTEKCIEYANGKNCFVAGVNPKKAGEKIFDVPIFASVKEAKAADRRHRFRHLRAAALAPPTRSGKPARPTSISPSASPRAFRCATCWSCATR